MRTFSDLRLRPDAVLGKLGFQKIHLIGENVLIGEIEKFIAIWHEWDSQQLQACFLGSMIRFSMITTLARGNDIGPAVGAAA